jgi:hypothetical protein
MSTKVSALKRFAGAFQKMVEAKRYGVHGKPFVCQLCGHERFKLGSDISIIGLYSLACDECSHVEFFAQVPPLLDKDGLTAPCTRTPR